MTEGLSLSVVICTYSLDRWGDLVRSVDSVREQTDPVQQIVIVVDHNPQMLERVRAEWPDLDVVPNGHDRGLSGARNTGIAAAEQDIIAFLDDDATADAAWAAELRAAYAAPDVLGVGGASLARWDVGRPGWFPREFDWVVGCSYHGLPERTSSVRNFIGSNMSFRGSALRAARGFDQALGRIGARPTGCEETELCIRLAREHPGQRLVYEPRASVGHRVPAARSTWSYFRARCYAEGQSKAIVSRLVGRTAGLSTERRYTVRVLPAAAVAATMEALRCQRMVALARAGAICAGLAATAFGYLVATVTRPGPSA